MQATALANRLDEVVKEKGVVKGERAMWLGEKAWWRAIRRMSVYNNIEQRG